MRRFETIKEVEAPKVPAPPRTRKPSKAKPQSEPEPENKPKGARSAKSGAPAQTPAPAPKDPRDALTVPQTRAIAELLRGSNVDEAARAAKVSRATVFRWLKSPDFQTVFRAERIHVLERASTVIQSHAADAANVIVSVMNNPAQPAASIRLRAALEIHNLALAWRETEDMALEIERIKAVLGLRDAPQTSQAMEL